MAKNDLIIEIHADTKKAVSDIEKLKTEIKQFGTNIKASNGNLGKQETALKSLTGSLKKLALAYGGFEIFKTITTTIADFEQSIAKLGAISGASASDLATLEDKARALGESTQFSASQVAEAMNYQAMAGMKTNEILKSTADVLDLASVGQMDLARASDIATDSMSGFGLKADDMQRVTDVMATTTTNANTNVEQLGEAFKNVAPVSKNLNVSLEETSAMLGVLANSGKKGGEAGTHLKIILQRLASTAPTVVNALDSIGLSAYDSNGKLKPITQTLKEIQNKLKDLSEQDRNSVLKDVFGEEAIASGSIILGNLRELDTLIKKVSNSNGEASKIAQKMNDNLSGAHKEMMSALEGLALTIGDDLLPALRDTTDNITSIIRSTTEFYKENRVLIKTITELGVAFVALSKVRAILMGIVGASMLVNITSIGSAFVALKGSVKALQVAMLALNVTPLGVALTALSAVVAGVTYAFNEWEESIRKVEESTEALQKSTKTFQDINNGMEAIFVNGKIREGIIVTDEEIKKLKSSISGLIKEQDKQLEQLHKNDDGSSSYAQKIEVLTNAQKLLKKELKLVIDSEKDIHKESIKNAEKATKSTQEYTKKIVQLSKEEIEELNKTYTKRVTSHTSTIEKLKSNEIDLSKQIIDINEDLQNKLTSLENQRVHNSESIETQISSIIAKSEGAYSENVNAKIQAEENLSRAKQALTNGDLENYRHYADIYKSLVSGLANTEVMENDKVKVSKAQNNDFAITSLNTLKGLEDGYYAQKKAEEVSLHNQKVQQLQVQLQATKAQLEMEVQRLQIEKQIVEATTGKTISIDISGALASIRNIDNQINVLDSQIRSQKPLSINTSNAIASINQVRQSYGSLSLNDVTVRVNSDTTPADFGIKKLINSVNGDRVTIEVNPEYQKAEKEINKVINNFEKKDIVTPISADTKKVSVAVDKVTKDIERDEKTLDVNADTKKAIASISKLEKQITSVNATIKVNADTSRARSLISALSKNTSSTHTVYVRRVERNATGGQVGVLHLATGGIADFKPKKGRIAGYDATDSDDVPSMLTRGEFVIKRETVKHYGNDFLNKINNMQVQKYATGGLVQIGNPQELIEQISSGTSGNGSTYSGNNVELLKDDYKYRLDNLSTYDLPKSLLELIKALKAEINNSDDIEALKKKNSSIEDLEERVQTHNKNSEKLDDKVYDIEYIEAPEKIDKYDSEQNKRSLLDITRDGVPNELKWQENSLNNLNTNHGQLINTTNAQTQNIEKKISDLLDFINSNDESELSEKKLSSILSGVDKRKNIVDSDTKKFENSREIIESYLYDDSYKIESFGNEVEAFFEKIEQVQSRISDKFSSSNVSVPYSIQDSLDFNRLNKFLKLISEIVPAPRVFRGDHWHTARENLEAYKREHGGIIPTMAQQYQAAIPKFKAGGAIDGTRGGKLNGYGGGDRNLALLEDGEFIVRKEAVSNLGTDYLHKLNSMSVKLPKFQIGGLVGSTGILSSGDARGETNINFKMPSGNNFEMSASVDVATALAQEFKRLG